MNSLTRDAIGVRYIKKDMRNFKGLDVGCLKSES